MNRSMMVGGAILLAAILGIFLLMGKRGGAPAPPAPGLPEASLASSPSPARSGTAAPPRSRSVIVVGQGTSGSLPAPLEAGAREGTDGSAQGPESSELPEAASPRVTPPPPGAARETVIVSTLVAGRLTGRVKSSQKPGRPKKINMAADPKCQALWTEPLLSEEVVVNDDNFLQWAFVYVKSGLEGRKFEVPQKAAELEQVGCHYVPHVLGVQAGQKIRISNGDDLLHNIMAFPFSNPGFNFGQPQKGMMTEKEFKNSEVMIKVSCGVHPWMGAWVGVLDHPFFATTDSQGAFRIEGLPPGRYTLRVWHERLGSTEREIEVGPDAELKVDFTLGP